MYGTKEQPNFWDVVPDPHERTEIGFLIWHANIVSKSWIEWLDLRLTWLWYFWCWLPEDLIWLQPDEFERVFGSDLHRPDRQWREYFSPTESLTMFLGSVVKWALGEERTICRDRYSLRVPVLTAAERARLVWIDTERLYSEARLSCYALTKVLNA